MLDGERLQNRGLSLLRKRRDKGELIKGVGLALSSQLGGLRALGRAGCHPSSTGYPANTFFGQKRPPELLRRPNWLPVFLQCLGHFPPQIILSASTCSLSYLWENLLVGKNLDPQPQPIPLLLLPQTMYTGACLSAKYKDGSSLQPWWYTRWSLIHYPRLCLWSCLVAGWPRGLVAQWSLVIFSHPCHVLWDPISGGLSSPPPFTQTPSFLNSKTFPKPLIFYGYQDLF